MNNLMQLVSLKIMSEKLFSLVFVRVIYYVKRKKNKMYVFSLSESRLIICFITFLKGRYGFYEKISTSVFGWMTHRVYDKK